MELSRKTENPLIVHDCPICLQKCFHPTKLPCGHVFCFLCVKGVAIQSKKCAMCRAIIPRDYLDNPVVLEELPSHMHTDAAQEYQWYYEGRNGWWKYDERSNAELESAFNSNQPECTLLLAGTLYCIDFQNMTQVRRSDQTRKRKVKRDSPSCPAKGIAGIKMHSPQEISTKTDNTPLIIEIETDDIIVIEGDDEVNDESQSVIIVDDNNDDDVIEIIQNVSTINLADTEP